MLTMSADYLRKVGTGIGVGFGAPRAEAEIVANELVESNLMGFDSHGIIRYTDYYTNVQKGKLIPGAPIKIVKETPTTALVDCGLNFGAVGASRMADIACEKAQSVSIACVVSRNCNHVGRLGAWVQQVAERGMFAMATANGGKTGHIVAPWGGKAGRLATNPMAYAAPTSGYPIVLDMATCMIAEGKVRMLMHEGERVPPGCVQDPGGNPITDPVVFYGPPHGTIKPFGSEYGYKGYGLSLMVEILGAAMAGEYSSREGMYTNGFCLIAVDPEAFSGREFFRELMDDLVAYHASTPPAPGFDEVVLPGTYEFRTKEKRLAEGIPVRDEVWKLVCEVAAKVNVDVEQRQSDN